jgi:competence protein ComEA
MVMPLLFFAGMVAVEGAALQSFSQSRLVASEWADGDSFKVRLASGDEIILRLYYVDCPETVATSSTDQRRVRDQSSYFGIGDHSVTLAFGKRAAERVEELLAKPFTVHTAMAKAPGRSSLPRHYGFVALSDGRDLGEVLIEEGLARSYGIRRATPGGRTAVEAEEKMTDRELAAALGRVGLWGATEVEQLVALRQVRREEARELREEFGRPHGRPVNANKASIEEMQQLPGVGPVLARRIVEQRPYAEVEDLRGVPGIGDNIFEKLKGHVVVAP